MTRGLCGLAMVCSCGATPGGHVDTAPGGPDAAPVPTVSCEMGGLTADAVVPGALTFPHPTLEHIAIVWSYAGDPDLDAVTRVRFRPVDGAWREALPLRRAQAATLEGVTWGARFAGTIFGLAPASTYEVEVTMMDDDGACARGSAMVATRARPAPMPNAPVRPATPSDIDTVLAAALPGDILELTAGTYGPLIVAVSGEPDRPIVLRAAQGQQVIIAGDVRIDEMHDVQVVGLTVRGQIKFNHGVRLAIMNNRIEATVDGVVAFLRAEDIYVGDNDLVGQTVWAESSLGVGGNNVGDGIVLTGPGHVIEHNRVHGFRDCVSFLEEGEAVDQYAIDVLRNDLSVCADDGVEADFCLHNCRMKDNRLTDTFIAMSSQPGLGGPTYFVGNVIFNTMLTPFKLLRGSQGDVLFHNTVVKAGDALGIYSDVAYGNLLMRNNLFWGGMGGIYNGYGIGDGAVLEMRSVDAASLSMDFDGLGSTQGFSGRVGDVSFESLSELQQLTTAVHAQQISAATFVSVPFTIAPFPGGAAYDVQLSEGVAVDAGVALPTINDGAVGAAPDMGALERGGSLPTWGPR